MTDESHEIGKRADARCMGDAREGKRCRSQALPDSRYCLTHKYLESIAPQRNGRYAAAMGRFGQAYQQALNDKDLLDLREPIAALDAIIQRWMKRLDEGDTFELRQRARELVLDFIGLRIDDPEKAWEKIKELQQLLLEGVNEDRTSVMLAKALERQAKRMTDACALMLNRRNAVNARDVVAVLARVIEILKSEATPDVVARVVERVSSEVMSDDGRMALVAERAQAKRIFEAKSSEKPQDEL